MLFSVSQAVDDMNGKELNGKNIYVGRAQKRLERQGELKRKFDQIKQDRIQRYQVLLNSLKLSLDDSLMTFIVNVLTTQEFDIRRNIKVQLCLQWRPQFVLHKQGKFS